MSTITLLYGEEDNIKETVDLYSPHDIIPGLPESLGKDCLLGDDGYSYIKTAHGWQPVDRLFKPTLDGDLMLESDEVDLYGIEDVVEVYPELKQLLESKTLSGDPDILLGSNGILYKKESDSFQPFAELADELGKGFGFKMPKMPKFKFKAPKIPKMPKMPKMPKIKMKGIKINTKGITKGISSVGKSFSKAASSAGKAFSSASKSAGKAFKSAGKAASGLAKSAGKAVSSAAKGLTSAVSSMAQGMNPGGEQPEEEEQPQTDENGNPIDENGNPIDENGNIIEETPIEEENSDDTNQPEESNPENQEDSDIEIQEETEIIDESENGEVSGDTIELGFLDSLMSMASGGGGSGGIMSLLSKGGGSGGITSMLSSMGTKSGKTNMANSAGAMALDSFIPGAGTIAKTGLDMYNSGRAKKSAANQAKKNQGYKFVSDMYKSKYGESALTNFVDNKIGNKPKPKPAPKPKAKIVKKKVVKKQTQTTVKQKSNTPQFKPVKMSSSFPTGNMNYSDMPPAPTELAKFSSSQITTADAALLTDKKDNTVMYIAGVGAVGVILYVLLNDKKGNNPNG